MTHVAISAALATVLLCLAGCLALVPVKLLRRRIWSLRGTEEHQPSDLREITALTPDATTVAKLMSTYLHGTTERDHLKMAAAVKNLHPIGREDVLTQIVYLRRDVNRISRLIAHSKFFPTFETSVRAPESEFLIAMDELVASPRAHIVAIRYFTHRVQVTSGLHSSDNARRALRHKLGVMQ